MPKSYETDKKAMELLMSKGIISRDVTLRDLVAVSSELASLNPLDELAAWTFITPNYVYKGDKVADFDQEITNR